jgi:DNA (cytosine-5)-methyltransferase 1
MVSLRVASLFSGIGGLDQGLARAGHRIVLMCERDEHCKQVLAARFPGVPLLNDVAEVLPFMIEQCDLIAAGNLISQIYDAGI